MRQFDPKTILTTIPVLLPYLWITLAMALVCTVFSLLLGSLVAAAKLSRHGWLRKAGALYTGLMRCTPSLVMMFLIYYGVPKLSLEVFHKSIDDWPRGIFVGTALIILFSAPMSEVIRSAWLAVPAGQFEAAAAAGFSRPDTLFRIIIPQMWSVALPNLGSTAITLLKEGANAFTIGFIDLIGKANLVVSNNLGAHSREIYLAAALIYWAVTFVLERLLAKAEAISARGRREPQT